MAENKTSFVLYSDSKTIIDMLSNEEAGLLLKTLFAYVNDESPIIDNSIRLVFEMIKLQLKRDLKKWEKTKKGRSLAGKASAEARKLAREKEQKSTNSTNVKSVQQSSTNPTVSVSVNDSVSVSVNDSDIKESKPKRINKFIPPTFLEVKVYFIENGYSETLAKKAFDYYDIANWKDSKGNPVKNWKQKMLSVWFKEENKNNLKTIQDEQLTEIARLARSGQLG